MGVNLGKNFHWNYCRNKRPPTIVESWATGTRKKYSRPMFWYHWKQKKILFHSLKIPINPLLGNFFMTIQKVEPFSFLCINFYKKILSITRQRKDATAVAQLTLILNARVSYHKCQMHNCLTLSGIASQSRFWNLSAVQFVLQIDIERYS